MDKMVRVMKINKMSINKLKVLIVGDEKVGKTAFVDFFAGRSTYSYKPTVGVAVTKCTLKTSAGNIELEFWDCAGRNEYRGLTDGYYQNANCAFIMYNTASMSTYKNVPHWHRDVRRMCPDVPILLVGMTNAPSSVTHETTKYTLQHYELNMSEPDPYIIAMMLLIRKITKVTFPSMSSLNQQVEIIERDYELERSNMIASLHEKNKTLNKTKTIIETNERNIERLSSC